jgi:PAS domain S-box-containing protein
MKKILKSRFLGYGWAGLGTAAAVVCRELIPSERGTGTLVFYGILFVSITASGVGGVGPAIAATLLGALASDYYMLSPEHAFSASAASEVGLALFLILGAILISFAEMQRRRQQAQIDALRRFEMESVRASQERFRRLVEVSAQTVWVANKQGEVMLANSPSSPEQAAQPFVMWSGVSNWLEAVHPEDRERVEAAWRRSLETATPYRMELRFLQPSGEYRYMASHAAPVFNADGTVREWIGMSSDITARKEAERALAEAIQRLDAHMDNSPLAVIEFDRQMRIIRWSKEAERLFGWEAREVRGRAIFDFRWIHDEDAQIVSEIARDMIDGKRPRNMCPNRNYRKDGSVVECEWYNSAIYDRDGKLSSILSQGLDITNRKRTEERLRQAQKMESVAVLVGGVAHDFNNLLVSVIGNASLALEVLPPESPAVELLQSVINSGEHAAHLTRQMLDYSGKGRYVVRPVDLSEVVREVSELIRASAPKNIAIELDLDPKLPAIEADRTQIHQVLMNLVINATEAIGGKAGLILLRTGVRRLDEAAVRELGDAGIAPGRYVFLQVRDDGCGMDEATKARIFDPFFTTKFTGRGLGLAAVSGIVRGHKGAIEVSTNPGQGTTFTVFLPAAEGAPETVVPAPAAERDIEGTGKVLVVDDEDAVCELARRGLEHYGYEVLVARDALEASRALSAAGGSISAIVLDLSMPGKSGQDLLLELQEIQPGVPVLISSGYSEEEVLKKFDGSAIAGFVPKPYTVQQLVRTVNALTSGAGGARSMPPLKQ